MYILIHFLHGSLPWQNLGQGVEGQETVVECKQKMSVHDLCRSLPVKFCTLLEYACSLTFDDKPDYGYLFSIFKCLSLQEGF
jgi:hypothetical protein